MLQYDENGLVIQNLSEILDERETKCRSIFGDDFIISGESVVANLQTSDADRELSLQQLLLYIASQLDPNQAEGIWLDYICALNNISRYPATKSIIPITITGVAGTTKNARELTIVDENTDEYYTNANAIVLDINGTANADFEATSFGPITALSSSTFSLKTPSIGINSISYNTSGLYKIGRDVETDYELRIRREENLEKSATSTINAIRSAVSEITDVQDVNVIENSTNSTVDGIPAHSFETIVLGGDNTAIAQTILSKKPAGIQAYGTTTVPIVEDLTTVNIGFTRPTEVSVSLQLTFVSSETQTTEWIANLKEELLAKYKEEFSVGDSIYVYKLYCVLNSHPEITNVTNFQVKETTSGTWDDSLAITNRQIGILSLANITITQSV